MKRYLAVLLVTLLLVLMSGCEFLEALLQEGQQRIAIKNCKFKILDVSNIQYNPLQSLTELSFDMKIGVRNPNDAIDATMDRMAFVLFVNERNVLETETQEKVTVPSGGEAAFTVPIILDALNVGTTIVQAIQEERAEYKVTGTAFIKTKYGTLEFPVTIVEGTWSADDSQEVDV